MKLKHGPFDMLPQMWRKATNIAMVSGNLMDTKRHAKNTSSAAHHSGCPTSLASAVRRTAFAAPSLACSSPSCRGDLRQTDSVCRRRPDDVVFPVKEKTHTDYSIIRACMTCIWVFPKIGGSPQIIHFNRVFHYIHHPF